MKGKLLFDAKFNRVLFEIILMDLLMPEMGGYEATQHLRKIEKELNLSATDLHYICGISAFVNADIQRKCLESGMNTIKEKPVYPDTLKQLLEDNRRESNLISTIEANGTGFENMSSKNSQLRRK
jgi:CheY-like chemotaxis protein